MSLATRAMLAAKTAVKPPMTATTVSAAGLASNSGNMRATKKTPAATMVAAWMSDDTGVGPSMASGSHVWSGNCADLPAAPANSPSATHVTMPPAISGVAAQMSGISKGLRPAAAKVGLCANRYSSASRKPKSPRRVMMNAFLAAFTAAGRSCQKPMSR